MKTLKNIHDERAEEFINKIDPVHFKDRAHTCEGWNGLGDEMYGRAYLSEEGKGKIKYHNNQITLALLENLVEWLETLQTVANHNPMYNDKEYDSYNNGYNTAIDDTVNYLKEQIKLISK